MIFYSYYFHLDEFHGHHKASTVIALQALERAPKEQRPIALHAFIRRGMDDPGVAFIELEE